jgi:hypothetical protein
MFVSAAFVLHALRWFVLRQSLLAVSVPETSESRQQAFERPMGVDLASEQALGHVERTADAANTLKQVAT